MRTSDDYNYSASATGRADSGDGINSPGNSSFNPGGYPPQYYNQNPYGGYPPPKKPNNSGLIALISVLACIIVIGITILILMLTGVISIGNSDKQAAAPVVTAAPIPTATAVQQAPAVPAYQGSANTTVVAQKYVANVKYSIYLRSEPFENDSNIICEIPLGTQVGYIENTDNVFAKINYNGIIGYSKLQYLSDMPPYVSSNNTVSSYKYVANVKYSIYFRSAPAENDSNIICEIPLGTQVGYIETVDGTFSKISYNGTIGYVKTQYLSSSNPKSAKASSNTMTVVNVKYAIYLRSTPSETADNIIMEIPVGATVTYLGTPDSTFYKISYGGTVGYSKQEYLAFN